MNNLTPGAILDRGKRQLKNALKQRYFQMKLRGLEKRPAVPLAGRPAVAGFLSSPFGLGVGARLIADGLAQAGHAPSLLDIAPKLQPDRSLLDYGMPHEDDGRGPVIIHVNPPELGACLDAIGPGRLAGRRLIGYWAWEQERVPPDWSRAARWLDEVWVPSRFVQTALQGSIDIPVTVTGYPSGLYANHARSPQGWRQRLGLDDCFMALAAFDPRSGIERKNPQAAIAAFQEAFPEDEKVRLVLKVTGQIAATHAAELSRGDKRIIFVDDLIGKEEMLDLIASADCVLNLHRAEGYGLLPVQALCLGIPAVMTGWSSVTDFADSPGAFLTGYSMVDVPPGSGPYSSRHGRWAEPDITDAASCLRRIRALDAAEREQLGTQAAAWWREHHSPAAFVDRIPDITSSLFKPD